MFTSLYIKLTTENDDGYVEVSRWDGVDPVEPGDLLTIHGPGAGMVTDMVTAKIDARRWGVQRGDRVRSLELYAHLVRFDGTPGDIPADEAVQIVRRELAASGDDAETIDDVMESDFSKIVLDKR
jgi:hypothetical protein